jgi:hypothetical protein
MPHPPATPQPTARFDLALDYAADRSPQGDARIHARIRAVADLLLHYRLVTDDPTIRRITNGLGALASFARA